LTSLLEFPLLLWRSLDDAAAGALPTQFVDSGRA
jgi:hypothetical protein